MNEPAGICPGVGIDAGGARLAVGLHDVSSAGGGAGCTISAPLGRTLGGATETGLTIPDVPHAAKASDATTTRTAPRPRRPMVRSAFGTAAASPVLLDARFEADQDECRDQDRPDGQAPDQPVQVRRRAGGGVDELRLRSGDPSRRASPVSSDEIGGRSTAPVPAASPTAAARLPPSRRAGSGCAGRRRTRRPTWPGPAACARPSRPRRSRDPGCQQVPGGPRRCSCSRTGRSGPSRASAA